MTPYPTLIVNPRSDDEFVTWAHEVLAADHPPSTPADLQRRLRQRYPDAAVRSRELSGEATVMWYVYRDGRWPPGDRNVGPEGER